MVLLFNLCSDDFLQLVLLLILFVIFIVLLHSESHSRKRLFLAVVTCRCWLRIRISDFAELIVTIESRPCRRVSCLQVESSLECSLLLLLLLHGGSLLRRSESIIFFADRNRFRVSRRVSSLQLGVV